METQVESLQYSYMENLPFEILNKILSDVPEIHRFTAVCRRWKCIIDNNQILENCFFDYPEQNNDFYEIANSPRKFKEICVRAERFTCYQFKLLLKFLYNNKYCMEHFQLNVVHLSLKRFRKVLKCVRNIARVTIYIQKGADPSDEKMVFESPRIFMGDLKFLSLHHVPYNIYFTDLIITPNLERILIGTCQFPDRMKQAFEFIDEYADQLQYIQMGHQNSDSEFTFAENKLKICHMNLSPVHNKVNKFILKKWDDIKSISMQETILVQPLVTTVLKHMQKMSEDCFNLAHITMSMMPHNYLQFSISFPFTED